MASRRHPTTIENLPFEILSEVFIRLLAKQLAQMRSVCKPWNTLLSESSFIKSHFHHSIHNNDEILLFFRWNSFEYSAITAHLSRSPDLELTNFIKFPGDPQSNYSWNNDCIVIGSMNGLICFTNYTCSDSSVYIWNPSLSALLTLPTYSLPFPSRSYNSVEVDICFGFGYDPKTDDYKVVKLTIFRKSKKVPQVEVYSMRKGYWELITQRLPSWIPDPNEICVDCIDYYLRWLGCEVCVDGRDGYIHWLGYAGLEHKRPMIGTFDLGAETFCEISLPDSILDYKYKHSNVLGVLSGKLCVMSCVKGGECAVWVMNEYGVAESWVKNHVFSQFSGDITPYGFTSHGEFIFDGDDGFALYDPVTAQTKIILKITKEMFIITTIVEYVDTLVWVAPNQA